MRLRFLGTLAFRDMRRAKFEEQKFALLIIGSEKCVHIHTRILYSRYVVRSGLIQHSFRKNLLSKHGDCAARLATQALLNEYLARIRCDAEHKNP